ncbi:CDP-glycerol glycerophosphotransferase family protein [Colwellia sp. MB3u-70]|uniref:CDP-glycerol glycerophosphotransferase family protein n=1 Tax=unclassified Colwellia TaxID=196834 RepID=UPI0015F5A62D|nr:MULTISPECIES: CDP-glycerol glycerophosphotransferase family protein [unclassified Colwellia]MBA6291607.1 CDP-glycerol glycerophosphotransferase family protein [Colwellia sp. MB3u-8]MBA6309214.1 CDP-glycerol glycerophosphotransferase family protein [Colwellia sp. MB3u-70]
MSSKKYLFYISQNYSFAILRPIQTQALIRGDQVAWFVEGTAVDKTLFNDDEGQLADVSAIFAYNPDAVLYPANNAPTFLPGINVAIFHGFDAGKLDKKGNNDHYKDRHCFELYCTQGPESTRRFLALQGAPKKFNVIETGWSALDRLFKPDTGAEKKSSLFEGNTTRDTSKLPNHEKPTILFCSTFSKRLCAAPHLLPIIKQLSESGRWRWLVQFHPKMSKNIVDSFKEIESEYLTFVETSDVIPLLKQADIMVCDTSSVMLMFLLQHKPVVTFKNIDPKGHLFDIQNPDELEQAIEYALTRPKELMDNIQGFINEVHPYHDGLSAQRVLTAIDKTIEDSVNLAAHPSDFIRQFKMRKKLNYWRF